MALFFALFLGLLEVVTAQDKADFVCNPCELRIAPRVAEKLLLQRIEPDYPKSVKATGASGQVMVRFVINKQGNAVGVFSVTSARQFASSQNPQIVAAATNAVKRWKFKPYLVAGEPVEAESLTIFHFDFSHLKK
jgi:protein TonB